MAQRQPAVEEAHLSIDIPVPVPILVLDLRCHSLDLAESSCCPESAAGQNTVFRRSRQSHLDNPNTNSATGH